MGVRQIFSFPNPVNETSARLVATGVVAQAVAFLIFREGWLLVPLVFGFAARVLTGPTLSPLGQFSTRVATPFVERRFGIESRRVPGPPKRFAQMVGLAFSGAAAIGWVTGATWATYGLLAGLVVAASLEAVLAICLGCIAYSAIWGCDDCDDISERLSQAVLRARVAVPADPVTTGDRVPTH
ncbi:MAG: DUF4395 domain-containing protein [Ilumatobacter sp.]|uniref:DUF4395 domain-containing protein n=1 Tax=Ilumatobacter sp. TaxID=1967498 RepID=UPI003298230A